MYILINRNQRYAIEEKHKEDFNGQVVPGYGGEQVWLKTKSCLCYSLK